MDALSLLLDALKRGGQGEGHLRGMLHVFIGRTITRIEDGALVSKGMTWRELAGLLKKVRWDPEAVRDLGVVADALPPRDRQRFWYVAIAHAKVDSVEAIAAGDQFVEVLRKLGYAVK